jgi:hypothetical protein
MNDERSSYDPMTGRDPAQEAPPAGSGQPYADQGPGWAPPRESPPRPRKSAAWASLLSCMPGLGQIYVGYYQRGFVHIIVVAALITLLSSGSVRGLEPLFGLFLAFFWLYNIVDAGRRANAYNQLLDRGRVEQLPELSDQVGGKFTGRVLVVFGVILLMHTLLGFDFDWLEDWWPLAVIGFGVYILWRNRSPAAG